MLRLAIPLVLLAALAAGRTHAQSDDRYGPRAGTDGRSPPSAVPLSSGRFAVASVAPPQAPALRRLSWPGKAELRPSQAPIGYAPAPEPAVAPAPRLATPAYAAPAPQPGLRAATAPADSRRAASPPGRAVARRPAPLRSPAAASAPPSDYATSPVAAPSPPAAALMIARPAPGSPSLPPPLAAPPAYVPPGPTAAPAARASTLPVPSPTTPNADALPPPTVGRYGYVGPGRVASVAAAPTPASSFPQAQPQAQAVVTPKPQGPASADDPGPPQPPAYARAYVLPTAAAVGRTDGVRRYSVRREYGVEPDPITVAPQTFATTPDMSAPETEPVVPRTGSAAGKAQVNAARLAASGQN